MNDDILSYENRSALYKVVAANYELEVVNEKYYSKDSFYVTLAAPQFFVRYVVGKREVTIQIGSKYESEKWYDLLTIKNFLNGVSLDTYEPALNNDAEKTLIMLNEFLNNHFREIELLFCPENYFQTRQKIDLSLKEMLFRKYKKPF